MTIVYLVARGIAVGRAVEAVIYRYTVDTVVAFYTLLALHVITLSVPPVALVVSILLALAYTILLVAITTARLSRYVDVAMRWLASRLRLRQMLAVRAGDVDAFRLDVRGHLAVATLSAAQWLIFALTVKAIFEGFGVQLTLADSLVVILSYVALTYISLLPGSAGIGEVASFYILEQLGLGSHYLQFTLWFRVTTYAMPLIAFLPAFLAVIYELSGRGRVRVLE